VVSSGIISKSGSNISAGATQFFKSIETMADFFSPQEQNIINEAQKAIADKRGVFIIKLFYDV
jgi:hypothetical protein